MDPRKPINHQIGNAGDAVRQIVHAHLIECTDKASQTLRCTGASFVTMGVGIWAAEMAELDPTATSHFLRALADIIDPRASNAAKASAEDRRKKAVRRILGAVDLAMNETEGRA